LSREVILVVEDEALVRLLLVDTLLDAGFEALSACNADEAIKILESRADIRMVVTDINMPGSMNGLKLAAAVRDRWPPVRIIITTARQKPENTDMPAESAFIGKPYDPDAMISIVKNQLAA
jgi:two-component system, response regulator PdtaR